MAGTGDPVFVQQCADRLAEGPEWPAVLCLLIALPSLSLLSVALLVRERTLMRRMSRDTADF